ncbi:kunitz trypsin inhibitor 4-like [Henckelia pumila]|uniref:kunitz trypsin inhibitor 4-like n=1 Tax=Henckelia pumila TaxID=405737 RepID=UPI003C6DBDD9
MKNDLIFSFITLLIFLHTATQAQEEPDAVLDWDGNALLLGESYYVVPIVPIINVRASGLLPFVVSKENCRYGVSQTLSGVGVSMNFSLIVTPYNHLLSRKKTAPTEFAVPENVDLDISFSTSVGCGPSDRWKSDYDNATEQYFVMIGAEPRKNPPGIIGEAFQIRKVGIPGTYEFVFCPQTCFSCVRKCHAVGIVVQGGVRRLVVSTTGEAFFPFSFRKYLPEHAMD